MINGYRQALFLFSVFFVVVCSTLWTTTIQAATRTKTHHLSQSKTIQAPPPTTASPNTTAAATNTTTAAPANTTAAPTTNTTTAAPATWRSRTRTMERSPQHQGTTTGASPSTTTHAPNTTSNQTTQAPPPTAPTTSTAPPRTTHHYHHSMTRTQQREEPSTTSAAPTPPPNTTSNTTTKAPAPETTTTPAPSTQQPHQRTATREVSRSPMSITPEGDRTSTVSPSTTIRAPTTTTHTPAPPSTTQQQKEQTSTTRAQQERGTSTTAAAVATTTDAPSPTPKPKKRNPRVEFVLANIARGRTNTTAANFQTLLAEMLSIPANAMSVTYDESAGVMLVEFKEDATDSSGNTLNATAEFEKAVTLDTTQLNNLGAASVTSTEPAPAPEDNNNNDDDKKPNLGLILGIVGGVLVLAVVAYIVKVKSSGTTGSKYEESADPSGTGFVPSVGDRPMLEVPQHHSHHTQL